MKKNWLILLVFFTALNVKGQDLVSKRGENMLPDSGDWAVAVDASPFFNYLGNIFSSAGNNSIFKSFGDSSITVMGKYFLSPKKAVRVKLNVAVNSQNQKFNTTKDGQTDVNVTVTDEWKSTETGITLGAGIEKRKGKTRLQGIYGAEASLFYIDGKKDKYKYGNSYSKNVSTPASNNFNGNLKPDGSRVTQAKQGATYGVGVRGFIGMEYYIFPKIAIGMEYGLALQVGKTGDGQIVSEIWDPINSEKKTVTQKVAGGSLVNFNSGLKNGNALIYAAFHF
jgi:hypothetical protein